MTGSLAAGSLLASLTPAVAQPSPTEDAQELPVEATAHYTYPLTDALPPTLTSEFPPGVVCVVAPQLCPQELQPVGDAVSGAVQGLNENEPTPPADPVLPGDLPVGILAGTTHYEAALKFALPDIPDGEEISSFRLVLTETQPTFHTSSPAFRQAVLAAMSCVSACDVEEFNKLLGSQPIESAVIGVEACPLTAPFEEGGSQPPPDRQPVDCLYGGNAERLDDGRWVVDLTFAVQAWRDGNLDNHGILLRPTGAANLAFGDPDPTTSAQVTFQPAVMATVETAPATQPPPGLDAFDGRAGGGPATSPDGSTAGGGDGFSSAPSGGVSSAEPFSPPASGPMDDTPVVADPAAPADAAGGATSEATAPVAGVLGGSETAPGNAWWVWLLVPVFAAGMWATARVLTADPMMTATSERAGAMTRLIARQAAGRAAPAPARAP